MEIAVKIKRKQKENKNAEKNQNSRLDTYSSYTVEVEPTTRLIDALVHISRTEDPTLTFRMSCAHGVCGSDAMIINGKERLACKTLIQDIVADFDNPEPVTIEPLKHFPVERDLSVDQDRFMKNFRRVKPYFIPQKNPPKKEEYLQSPEDRELYDDATKCISCGACFSACDILDSNPDFIGPMAIVQAARFINDSRDKGLAERIDALDRPNGIWACDNHFACTKVCPREIKITKLINFTKRKIKAYRKEEGKPVNDGSTT